MQDVILKLKELGKMPSHDDDNVTDEIIDEYSGLLDEIEKPVTFEEASILVELFPDIALYGVEWSLLQAFESVLDGKKENIEKYKSLIENCSSDEWKHMLKTRLTNWEVKQR